MKDFPAAHSNDTDWFGVDEEGNLAHFYPMADGASPMGFNPETLSDGWYELSSREAIQVCRFDFPVEDFPELLKKPGKFIPPEETGHFLDIGKPDIEEVWETDEDGNRELKWTVHHSHDYKLYAFFYLITTQEIIPELAPGVTVLYFPEVFGDRSRFIDYSCGDF